MPADQERPDDRPLGDTPEAHDEISPHDLPPDHPGRPAVIEQAGGMQGTTPGPRPDGDSTAGEPDPTEGVDSELEDG